MHGIFLIRENDCYYLTVCVGLEERTIPLKNETNEMVADPVMCVCVCVGGGGGIENMHPSFTGLSHYIYLHGNLSRSASQKWRWGLVCV